VKPRLSTRRNAAMSLFEVGIVVALIFILALVLLPLAAKKHSPQVACANNLRQIWICFKVWSGDGGDQFPMRVSITNGGSMEMVETGNVTQTFFVMSNEMVNPKILICPADISRVSADKFGGLSNSNISYFIGIDANDADPGWILSGDGNFDRGGLPVKPGLNLFWTNDPVTWSAVTRHLKTGNLSFTDGSVQSTTSAELPSAFQLRQTTGSATNRLAIP
jgi:hypothetical protein